MPFVMHLTNEIYILLCMVYVYVERLQAISELTIYKYGHMWSSDDVPDAHWAYQLISPSAEVFTKEELKAEAKETPTDIDNDDDYNPCK
jgi:hypothetical protein